MQEINVSLTLEEIEYIQYLLTHRDFMPDSGNTRVGHKMLHAQIELEARNVAIKI